MGDMETKVNTGIETNLLCPFCGVKGRPVKPLTIESLVSPPARTRAGRTDGFRFCADPSCDMAYFHPESRETIRRDEVRVRIGQKETTPTRTVCYCFHHTFAQIEAEVEKTGTSRIPDAIAAKCRQGLDRCEETNPQGACCLANVHRALKEAQAKLGRSTAVGTGATRHSNEMAANEMADECCAMNARGPSKAAPRMNAGIIAQVGALASAVVASACCWLPLLLIGFGVSGGALAATFEAWRPVLLPVTFALLGVAFYFTYRKPRVAGGAGSESGVSGNDCCSFPEAGTVEACCSAGNARGMSLKKVNRAMLWVVTAFVLAFAFFPNYVGYLLGGSDMLAARSDLDKIVVQIEGMTCEACAASIEDSVRKVAGVSAAEVSFERRHAVIGFPRGSQPAREAILSAFKAAGSYQGRLAEQVWWTLEIEGMTCEGCASGLRAALSKLPGVTSASVSYEQGLAHIAASSSVTEPILKKAVSELGYTMTLAEKN